MGQLLTSELVAYPTISATPLGKFNEVPFPEPEVDEQTYTKPLQRGTYSGGGNLSYGSIEASRVFDPATDEALLTTLLPLQGGAGEGSIAYHKAKGLVATATPLPGHTYDVVLLRVWLSDGVNSDGDGLVMFNCEFGVQGIGK